MFPTSFKTPPKRTKADAFSRSLEQLEEALAANESGREREWLAGLNNALAHVESGLRKHLAIAESLDGQLAKVEQIQPFLARKTEEVCQDLCSLFEQSVALRGEVQCAEMAATVRYRAEQLLSGLQQSRQAETALIQESVNTDIGVGD